MERVLTPKGAATRQRIVRGAAGLIRERGTHIGLDDVRAVTSTSKSQLFHYFPEGKSDLLRAVAAHEADEVLADQQPMLGNLNDWQAWENWRLRVIERYDEQRAGCPLTALTAQLGMADPETKKIITDLYDRWRAHLGAGVQALKDSGETGLDVDVDRAATAILTAVSGGASMLAATDRLHYLEVALAEALDALRRPAV